MSSQRPIVTVLQKLVAFLLTSEDPAMAWRLEEFQLKEEPHRKPYLIVTSKALAHEVRLCARQWGANEFRVAIRIACDSTKPTSSDGRPALIEYQQEPRVFSTACVMPLYDAEKHAAQCDWSQTVIAILFNDLHKHMARFTDDIGTICRLYKGGPV